MGLQTLEEKKIIKYFKIKSIVSVAYVTRLYVQSLSFPSESSGA
jgi:hypothetical protein